MPHVYLALLCTVSIKNARDFKTLSLSTYVAAAVVAVVAVGIAALWSNAIAWQPGANTSDRRRRKAVFWWVLVTAAAGFALYNTFGVAPCIARSFAVRFMKVSALATLLVSATYLVVGFTLSKAFASGKLGDWFHKSR